MPNEPLHFQGGSPGLPPSLIQPSCIGAGDAIPVAYSGLFADLGRVSLLEAQPVLSALSGHALTPGWTCDRTAAQKTQTSLGRGPGDRQHWARPHGRQTCLAAQFERVLPMHSGRRLRWSPASSCLTSASEKWKGNTGRPSVYFCRKFRQRMEGSQNVDSQPQGSVWVNKCKTEVNSK